jgi:hypothetical protein
MMVEAWCSGEESAKDRKWTYSLDHADRSLVA